MNRAKYLLFAALFAMAGMLASCTIEEGDSRPRKTQGEHAVYSSLYILHGRAIENLRMAIGFDAYLRQTTELGRDAVVARFFAWARVIEQKEYGWRLQYAEPGNMCCDFVIKDGLLLDQPGASWQFYCYPSSSSDVELLAELTNEEGKLRYKGYPAADSKVDWLVDVTLTQTDFAAEAVGVSRYEYRNDWRKSEVWTVDCRIDAPLRWANSKRCFYEGGMHIKAVLAGSSPRTIEFDAEQLLNGVRITAANGTSETWSEKE